MKYHVKRTSESERERMKGVAIRLKEFLGKLDKYSIAHDTERNLRKWIRGNDLCNSYMKQYFLRSNSTHTKILRSAPGTTCCKTCVCIAKQYIPDSFFECFSGECTYVFVVFPLLSICILKDQSLMLVSKGIQMVTKILYKLLLLLFCCIWLHYYNHVYTDIDDTKDSEGIVFEGSDEVGNVDDN